MSFANFTNPYRNPADVPEDYRKHPAIARRFRPDGTYLNTLEDPVTLWAIEILYRDYGVPLDAMEVEAVATTDRTDKTSRQAFARADLIIYGDRYIGAGGGLDVAFIMLEAMEPGKTFEGDEDLGWNYHYKQLNTTALIPESIDGFICSTGFSIVHPNETEVIRRRSEAKRLRNEAEAVVAAAKARVERIILGEEVNDD